jgi:hypothetical protein
MRRWPIILTGLLAAALLAFFSAPWFALRAVQSAARDGDVQALAELVDYPAVRAGMQPGGQAVALGPAPSVWADPIGAVRRAVTAERRAAPEVERRLTPEGLHSLAGEPRLFPQVRHWGPNRVRFAVRTEAGETLLSFQRRGVFRWRLVHLSPPRLSPEFVDPPRPAPAPP